MAADDDHTVFLGLTCLFGSGGLFSIKDNDLSRAFIFCAVRESFFLPADDDHAAVVNNVLFGGAFLPAGDNNDLIPGALWGRSLRFCRELFFCFFPGFGLRELCVLRFRADVADGQHPGGGDRFLCHNAGLGRDGVAEGAGAQAVVDLHPLPVFFIVNGLRVGNRHLQSVFQPEMFDALFPKGDQLLRYRKRRVICFCFIKALQTQEICARFGGLFVVCHCAYRHHLKDQDEYQYQG